MKHAEYGKKAGEDVQKQKGGKVILTPGEFLETDRRRFLRAGGALALGGAAAYSSPHIALAGVGGGCSPLICPVPPPGLSLQGSPPNWNLGNLDLVYNIDPTNIGAPNVNTTDNWNLDVGGGLLHSGTVQAVSNGDFADHTVTLNGAGGTIVSSSSVSAGANDNSIVVSANIDINGSGPLALGFTFAADGTLSNETEDPAIQALLEAFGGLDQYDPFFNAADEFAQSPCAMNIAIAGDVFNTCPRLIGGLGFRPWWWRCSWWRGWWYWGHVRPWWRWYWPWYGWWYWWWF